MKKHNQKGFGLVEALLVILILAVASFGGYYVWHIQSNRKINSTSQPNILPIKEWKITLNLSPQIKDASYKLTDPTHAYISTKSLSKKFPPYCGFATIIKANAGDYYNEDTDFSPKIEDAAAQGFNVKKIGQYYYYYRPWSGLYCTNPGDQAMSQDEMMDRAAFRTAWDTLQQAP